MAADDAHADVPARKERWLPHDTVREAREMLYLGRAVPGELLVARTDDVICVVRHIAAYPDGFSFDFVVRLREPEDTLRDSASTLFGIHQRRNRRAAKNIYVAVEFSTGEVITLPYDGQMGDEPVLDFVGGHGSSEGWQVEYVVPTLPSKGTVSFVCDWTAKGIEDARAEMPASAITEAAASATPIWRPADRFEEATNA